MSLLCDLTVVEILFGSKTAKHDYVIDMFVIFRPTATMNDDVYIRLYPIRLKKYSDSTRQQVVPKFLFL